MPCKHTNRPRWRRSRQRWTHAVSLLVELVYFLLNTHSTWFTCRDECHIQSIAAGAAVYDITSVGCEWAAGHWTYRTVCLSPLWLEWPFQFLPLSYRSRGRSGSINNGRADTELCCLITERLVWTVVGITLCHASSNETTPTHDQPVYFWFDSFLFYTGGFLFGFLPLGWFHPSFIRVYLQMSVFSLIPFLCNEMLEDFLF